MEHWSIPLSAVLPEGSIAHDQLSGHPFLVPFREFAPTAEGMAAAAAARRFPQDRRSALVQALHAQYAELDMGVATRRHVDALADPSTLTVTTGHQLNLFMGPMYVPIKIMDTLALARRTSRALGRTVVPVFWMASEDHDRAEVDHLWIRDRRIHWPGAIGGAVGRMRLTGIAPVVDEACEALGRGLDAGEVVDALRSSFRADHTWAQATRAFLHRLFGRHGLVIMDGDSPELKRLFIPAMREELSHGIVKEAVDDMGRMLMERHAIQAHARPINLFHLREGHRTRIEATTGGYQALQGGPRWSAREMREALERSPQDFSPNVLMRPLYQETILPNIAYVGGAGELAYWMQLKGAFQALRVPMPVVLLRSGAAILSGKMERHRKALGLAGTDLHMPKHLLMDRVAAGASGIALNTGDARDLLTRALDLLNARATAIDPTLARSVEATHVRAQHLVDSLEERMRRALRVREAVALRRVERILEELMPAGVPQERRWSMLPWMVKEGPAWIDAWIDMLDPLAGRFTVVIDQ